MRGKPEDGPRLSPRKVLKSTKRSLLLPLRGAIRAPAAGNSRKHRACPMPGRVGPYVWCPALLPQRSTGVGPDRPALAGFCFAPYQRAGHCVQTQSACGYYTIYGRNSKDASVQNAETAWLLVFLSALWYSDFGAVEKRQAVSPPAFRGTSFSPGSAWKGGMRMVTYSDLIQIGILVVAIIALFMQANKKK